MYCLITLQRADSEHDCFVECLVLARQLSSTNNAEDRQQMLESISSGSLLTWQHVNVQGEYDFRHVAANDEPFDMRKIRGLKLNQI